MIRRIIKKINSILLERKIRNDYRAVLRENLKLKNLYKGKRCFILGNGHSLKDLDLLTLKDEETFVVNAFWKHPQYEEVQPKNHVYVDEDVFRKEDIASYWKNEFFEEAKKNRKYPKRFFMHYKGSDAAKDKNLFPLQEKYYIAFHGMFQRDLKFNLEIDDIIPYAKNVIVSSIIIAIYMGFEKIYLLGCNHDILAHPTHYEGFKHFYDIKFDQNNPEEVKKYALTVGSYEDHIHHAGILFKNYRLLKEKLSIVHPEVKIFNTTPDSFLDVFPFIRLEDVIK
jgi:hypothetical protein